MRTTMVLGLALAALAACGGETATVAAAPAPAVEPAFLPVSPAVAADLGLRDGSDVTGRVSFKGDDKVKKRRKIKMDADPYCQSAHTDAVYEETVVIGDDGGVQWAFVWVKSDALRSEVPKEAVTIDQSGCQYKPHVFGMVAGQTIKILNSDDTNHNIHSMPKINADFNFGQAKKGMVAEKTFDKPEMPIFIKCDVHPWMGAWAHVLPHKYFAVTGADGKFKIEGLPAGKHTIEIWHEALVGAKAVEVEVDGKAAKGDVNFEFTGKAERK